MKFLHAADIHLDSALDGLERYEGAPVDLIRSATRRALENLVTLAIREKVDFVVIAGDLYDGSWRDFNTGMFFVRQVAKLRDSGIRVYLIAGNHDAASLMTRKLRLPTNPAGDSIMLSHELAETRRLDDLGVAIHGRSFANQAETRNMVPDYASPIPHWFNLGILHTSLNGSEEHDTYAPCTPAELKSKGYAYWALGHIHKRSVLPPEGFAAGTAPALYSGNIQGRHIREPGPRGCFLVTVDERHQVDVQFQALDVFRWNVCTVACAGTKSTDDVIEQFRTSLRLLIAQNEDRPMGVRVVLEGATAAHQALVSHRDALNAELRTAATIISDAQVWTEKIVIKTSYPGEVHLSADCDGPLAELTRYLDELPNDPQAVAELATELKELSRKLPPELLQAPDGLQLADTGWLREIVQELKPLLLDRLQS